MFCLVSDLWHLSLFTCLCFFFFLMIRRPPRSTRLTHSFPTRRSSDLFVGGQVPVDRRETDAGALSGVHHLDELGAIRTDQRDTVAGADRKSTRLNSSH